ncbi:Ig-like domain-containing protein [Sulfitobacter geojensis]|uniref:Ig-like domain-containing protein n=1 Tax=Sulfitobacter geojensis TaxID=1342299 RepID=UPI003B8E4A7E
MLKAIKTIGSFRTAAQHAMAATVVAVIGTVPNAGWANGSVTSQWAAAHGTGTPGCSNCHQDTSAAGARTTLSPYAQQLSSRLAYPDNGADRIDRVPPAQVLSAMQSLRSYLAPSISSVSALQGGAVISTQASPSGVVSFPAGTDGLSVTFNPGAFPFFGTYNGVVTPSVNAPAFSSTIPGGAISAAGSNSFTISMPDAETRRANRQAAVQPYALQFQPTNTMGFSDSAGLHASNRFSVSTANTPPVAAPDTFNPVLSQVQNASGTPIPLALNVLSNGRDVDPDHASAALSVTPASPVLSDPSYGSIARNGTGTGYVYTAPATLDPTAKTVTFSYSAVDEEGGTSVATTVTINVPAAAAPPATRDFVANNDLFLLAEDAILTGADVKINNGSGADDLDGATLSEVTFTSDDVSSGTLTFRSNGTFDYMPAADFSGDATFVYRLGDGTSIDSATVTIRVADGNDAPVVSPIQLVSANESRDPVTADLLISSSVSDPDGDTLSAENIVVSTSLLPAGTTVGLDPDSAVTVEGREVTITPALFEELDSGETANITVSYDVSDGIETVPNTLRITILGLDDDLGRVAGAYADTLSSRYVSNTFGPHFDGQSAAPSSCLVCHASLATIDADVKTVDQCVQTPNVFTQYGLDLCLNRDAGTPPLTDLVRRMAAAEASYAPVLTPTDTLQISQSATAGTAIGAPLTTSSTGLDVFGSTARIHSYLINAETGTPATTDPTGQFAIDESGQISVAGSALVAGTYTMTVFPVNDAGQRDNSGTRIARAGFFRQSPGPESAVTIEVIGDAPTPVDDLVNAVSETANTFAVIANDSGGAPDSVTIVSAPQNGTAAVNADLTVTYTPNAGFTGSDSFTYRSRNGSGEAANIATVTLSVLSQGAVLALDDNATAVEGRTTVIDVLANDQNVRRNGADATIVSITNSPDADTEGRVALDGQSILFTPQDGFTGTTSFTYLAQNPTSDGDVGSSATVTLSVVAVGGEVISAQITDPELLKVARVFEQSCSILRGMDTLDTQAVKFLDICTQLTIAASNDEDLAQAMRALRNEEHFAAVDATATVARGLGRVVSRRLSQIKDGGARGFNMAGMSLRVGDQTIPTEVVTQALRGFLGFEDDPLGNKKWGLFIAGDIAWAERDANSNSSGYDLEATNLMIGYDRVLSDTYSLGVALGYAETTTDFGGGGKLESEGYQATFYAVQKDFLRRDLTFEGYISVGQMAFNSDRRINFSNGGAVVDTIASAEFDGTYINIAPKLSYARTLGDYGDPLGALRTGTRVTWSASLDYLWMTLDDYTETGGAGLALNVESETYQSMILAFGVDASRPIYIGADTRAEIYGGIEIRGELLDKDRTVSSAFAAAGQNAPRFLVSEEGTYGLGAGIEIGTIISVGPSGQLDLNYGYDFSGGGLTSQHLTLGFTKEMSRNGNLNLNVSRNFRSSGNDASTAELSYQSRF